MKLLLRLFSDSEVKGHGHLQSGDGDAAVPHASGRESASIRQVLATADAYSEEGEHARSLACIDAAIARLGEHVELLEARGAILYEWGRVDEARDEFGRCALIDPDGRTVPYKLAWACLVTGNSGESLRWMRRAVELKPAGKTWFGLAVALEANGYAEEAIDNFAKAVGDEHTNFAYLIQYGLCSLRCKRFAEAESLFRRAIDVRSQSPVGWTNLGVVLSRQHRRSEALAAFERADRLETTTGENANNFVNLAVELSDDGRLAEAIAVYERHLPDNPLVLAHFGYAGALLRAGRMEEGWTHYEYRRVQQCPAPLRKDEAPAWSGQDLAARTILVEAEQGYGDTIQFVRYASMLESRGAGVVVRVPPALACLTRGFRGVHRVVSEGESPPPHDFRVQMPSLPHLFDTRFASIPGDTPYLRVDERRRAAWRDRLRAHQGINVGLAWAGNPNHARDEYRSIAPNALAPLVRVRGARFISLQKGDPGTWGSDPPAGLGLADFTRELQDFIDTAALIDALDLVISVDTAVLHLSGALGKPTWAMLMAPPDFRWMDTGTTTPWYPTMRLFREQRRDDWTDVIDRVSKALEEACASGNFRLDGTPDAGTPSGPAARDAQCEFLRTETSSSRRMFVVGETRYGMMQYRRDDLPIGLSLDRFGEYLQPVIDLFGAFLRPGMAVVETAAGIGAHSVPLASTLGSAGRLMLYEQDYVLRCVLQQNLRVTNATNVTIMRDTDRFDGLDELGLRRLDLFKVNGMRHGETLDRSIAALRMLRPFVLLESGDRSSFATSSPQLAALDYTIKCMAVPYYDPNNFRGNTAGDFEGRRTFVMLAIPHERDGPRRLLSR